MANPDNYQAPADINRLRGIALGIGGIALIIWAVGAYFNTEQALRSWLLGFVFWGGIAVGSLGVLMLQYLTGGAWGVVIRRIVEAGSRTMPMVALMFIPLAIGVYTHSIYEWTHMAPTEHVMKERGIYMTSWFWILRSVIYFALWGGMIYLLNKWGADQDKAGSVEDSRLILERASRFSGPTMVIYALVVTLAVVDWIMMLDPHWFSTMWGLLFVAGWALSCFCFCVAVLAFLMDRSPMDGVLGKRHFHDLGKLMLALTMVWAYFNFSQFLIIWSGNLPEEIPWYLTRMKGGWGWVSVLLIVGHFGLPYLLLLNRDLKRTGGTVAAIAVIIIAMRFVDLFWLLGPEHGQELLSVHWLDFVAPVAVGGIWVALFLWQLGTRPLIPLTEPTLQEAIEAGAAH